MIALSTGSLYTYGIARVFELAAQVGYDGIEVLIDGRWDTRDPIYLRRLSREFNLPIVTLHSPFVSDVPGWPPDQLGRLERTVALAQEMAVPVVVTHLPFRFHAFFGQLHGLGYRRIRLPIFLPRREPYYYALRDGRVQELEEAFGVTIAVENMPAHRFLGRRINAYWFNTLEEWPRFRHLTLDTTHLGTWGMDPVETCERVGNQVSHVHLSNFDGREHRAPADGQLPLDVLLGCLARDGYPGVISVESDPGALGAENVEGCRANLERALAFCRQHFIA